MTMKRSTTIMLGAAGIVMAASAWSLMGGEDDNLVYSDASSCRADGKLTNEQCDKRFDEARTQHTRSAKRFSAQGTCESEFGSGRCETVSAGGVQYWIPAFAGIMLARHLVGGGGLAQPLLPPNRQMCPPGNRIPECQPRSGSSSSGSGGRWYTTTSGGSVSTSRGSSSGSVSVTSRGGFGSTGRGFSSGS